MSTVYSRGPLCGVDNCPSRLWRRMDGQKVCQYGHVNTADLEINDEEDNLGAAAGTPGVGGAPGITRRLNNVAGLSQSRVSQSYVNQRLQEEEEESGRVYGAEAKKLLLEAYQCALNVQCDWMIKTIGVPKIFKNHVRELWVRLLILEQNVNDEYEASEDPTKLNQRPKSHIHLDSLVCLQYIACLRLRIPVYLADFISWIQSNAYPYDRIHDYLPHYFIKKLKGVSSMTQGDRNLYQVFENLILELGLEEIDKILIKPINYFPFLMRLTLRMRIPLEVPFMIKRLVDLRDSFHGRNRTYTSFTFGIKLTSAAHPELRVAAYLMAFTKVFFQKNKRMYAKWAYLIQSNRNEFDYRSDKAEITRFLNKETEVSSIVNWDDQIANKYLDFVNDSLLKSLKTGVEISVKKERRLAQKRLEDIFKLDPVIEKSLDESIEETKLQLIGIYNELYDNSAAKDRADYLVNRYEFEDNFEDIFAHYLCPLMGINFEMFAKLGPLGDTFVKMGYFALLRKEKGQEVNYEEEKEGEAEQDS